MLVYAMFSQLKGWN